MTTITRGTTNAFNDLGYEDAAERQTKTRLALAVADLLKTRNSNSAKPLRCLSFAAQSSGSQELPNTDSINSLSRS